MKIKHYCPKCKQEKELEGMTANIRAIWRYTFGEDYDFFKSKLEIERRNQWIFERIEIRKKMEELMIQIEKLEKNLLNNKTYREIIMLNNELGFWKARWDYKEKEKT